MAQSLQEKLRSQFPTTTLVNKTVDKRKYMPEVMIYTPKTKYNLTNDIRSYTFNRTLSKLTTDWTITLRFRYLTKEDTSQVNNFKYRITWLDLINNFDFIRIGMRKWQQKSSIKNTKEINQSESPEYVLSGIVRRIRQKKTIGTNSVDSDIVISGTTFGGILSTAQIFFHPNLPDTQAILGGKQYADLLQYSGTADQMITKLLSTFIYGRPEGKPPINGINFIGSKEKSKKQEWFDIGAKIQPGIFEGTMSANLTVNMTETTTLEQCIQPMIEKPFIECFAETNTSTGTEEIHIRVAPFSSESFTRATAGDVCININAEDIVDEQIATSDAEAYNLFFCTPAGFDIVGDKISMNTMPIFINDNWIKYIKNKFKNSISEKYASADTYGVRNLTVQSRYIRLFDTQQTVIPENIGDKASDIAEKSNALQVIMAEWFVMGHIFRAGTLVIKGQPSIKVGKYIKVGDKRAGNQYIYYVVGKTESWTYDGARYTQSLMVIRGLPESFKIGEKTTDYAALSLEIRNEVQVMLTREPKKGTDGEFIEGEFVPQLDNKIFNNIIIDETELDY